jgi:hypothetical protein
MRPMRRFSAEVPGENEGLVDDEFSARTARR